LNGNFGFTSFVASDGSTPDTEAPTIPANLAATAVSASQINIAWTSSTDNVGVAGYRVYRNGAVVGTTNTTVYADTGLTASTTFAYTVAAFDAAGNVSAPSGGATATTMSTTDTAPPSVPSNLQSLNVTSSSATLSWSASIDNVAVAGYRIFRDGTQVGTTALTSYSDAGLAASTTYQYTVAAYDTSGNVSAQSGQLSVTTVAAASRPPSFVQAQSNQITSGRSAAATFTSPTRSGNVIVAYVIWSNAGNVTLADTRGDSFVSAASAVTWGANYKAQVFYSTNLAGGASTVTATFQNAVNSFGVVYIHEYSGINASIPVDVTVSASGTSAALNSGAAVTTQANDLIFGAGVSDGAVTAAGSGFIARSMAYGNITEERIATSTGVYSATASHNGRAWGMQMVAFRPAN
jgi:chitodextrinase